jgi:hypothetical protein
MRPVSRYESTGCAAASLKAPRCVHWHKRVLALFYQAEHS